MKKGIPVIITGLFIIIIGILALIFTTGKPTQPSINISPSNPQKQASASATPKASVKDEILKNALNLYIQKKKEGVDMKNGPCLGKIADDWVLDIAHNPRQPVDDKSENQCADFREGKVHHFIELDPDGKLIKIY